MIDGSSGWPDTARHCLRLGAMNDKEIVERAQETFDVVVLQANLAISARNGLASWTDLERPFWIDPVAYAFSAATVYLKSEQKIRRGEPETRVDFKRTFRQLADQYGPPFTEVISDDRPLTPDDFDQSADAEVVAGLLDWQRSVLEVPAEDRKYLNQGAQQPVLLTIPFFPLDQGRRSDEPPLWLEVNLRLVNAAASLDQDLDRLAVGMLMTEDLFDDERWFDHVADAYLNLPIEHVWLWVSENDEVEMSVPRARRLRGLVTRLLERGKKVHQAFGGTFSSLLLADGLTSVGHGVAYWEHKSWEPLAAGGVPVLRYLYPPLGRRLRFLDADTVVSSLPIESAEDFRRDICSCETCLSVLDGDLQNFARYGAVEVRSRTDRFGNVIEYDVPRPEALRASKLHYLQAKGIEVQEVLDGPAERRERLQAAVARHQGVPFPVRNLERWIEALSGS